MHTSNAWGLAPKRKYSGSTVEIKKFGPVSINDSIYILAVGRADLGGVRYKAAFRSNIGL